MKYFGGLPVLFMSLAVIVVCGGCAVSLPSIPDRFPGGYSRLVHAAPECAKPDSDHHAGCMTAAEIYEQNDPRKATEIFIRFWDESVFGSAEEWMGSKSKGIQVIQRIVMPALTFIYDLSPGEYSAAMRPELKPILLDSLTSLESFRQTHMTAASRYPE
ncbi:MAG: hypothetical protein HZA19_00820 [Nitrospirae bacterium]|nr:hypothetical protein [Nitrospirota bacterium]